MTYLAPQYAGRITPPPAAIVEPVPGGRVLLLATEEPFSMDNPVHLVAADAIQAALAPLTGDVPAKPRSAAPTQANLVATRATAAPPWPSPDGYR